jgi:hypothetical protein
MTSSAHLIWGVHTPPLAQFLASLFRHASIVLRVLTVLFIPWALTARDPQVPRWLRRLLLDGNHHGDA